MLYIYQGNRLEQLADRFSVLASEYPLNPLQTQYLAVPNIGIGRWLKLHLAERAGICANLHVELPGAHAWRIFRSLFEQLPSHSAYEPSVLAWRLFKLLPVVESRLGFDAVANYLAEADEAMRFELAEQLASVYDQYLIYRPDWIRDWEAGNFEADNWQAVLWNELRSSLGGDSTSDNNAHWVHLLTRAREALASPDANGRLGTRSIVFGVASLSPAYLNLLAQLAQVQDVHLFVPAPCQEFWGDVVAERDLARVVKEDEAAEYYDTGNPLLSSLGAQGRDFFDQLAELEFESVEEFVDPGTDTALHCLQSEVLNLQVPGAAAGARLIDDSIRVHACHSPLRELEVLHDQLLDLFERLPDLQPGEVLIMSPDISAYAPYVESVFNACPPEHRLPFRVIDASALQADSIAGAFMDIINLVGGRFHASAVLSLLECEALRRRFGLNEDDLPRLHDWVRDTGIRWGLDGEHRARLGLNETNANTWRAGLDAMLLGMAMAPDVSLPLGDVMPHAEVEGDGVRILGGIARLIETLEGIAATLSSPAPASRWAAVAQRILERCFMASLEEEAEINLLRDCIIERTREITQAQVRESIPFSLFSRGFDAQVLAANTGSGFPGGAISVASLQPLRSVPFRVICLLGMNDDAFPRRQSEPGFDLMSASPRRGDRSRREDDRYLFLETVLSARDTLMISYLGQDLRSNEALPPCVLISELLDYLERANGSPWPLTRHPLQAYSARYFDTNGADDLFSYRHAYCKALQRSTQREALSPPLFGRGDDDPVQEQSPAFKSAQSNIALEQLLSFARNPARAHLLANAIRLPLSEEALLDEEPFLLAGLERWQLADSFADAIVHGGREEDLLARAKASGALPHGDMGKLQSHAIYLEQRRMLAELDELSPGKPLPSAQIEMELAGFQLTGSLTNLRSSGLAQLRAGKTLNGRALGPLWVQHLLLNVLALEGVTANTVVVTPKAVLTLPAMSCDDARGLLQAWLRCYSENLVAPAPLLALSSFAFAQALGTGDADDAIETAIKSWDGNRYETGERDDVWVRYLYRDIAPFDRRFAELASELCGPMYQVMKQEKSA